MTKQEQLYQNLLQDITTLKTQMANQQTETEPIAELLTKIAVLEHQVSELRAGKDAWQQRAWAVVIVLMSAFFSLISVLVGTLLTASLRK